MSRSLDAASDRDPLASLVGTAPQVDLRPASPTSDVRVNRWNVTINIEIEIEHDL